MGMSVNNSTDSIMSLDDDEQPNTFENIFVRAGLILVYFFIFVICFFGNLAVILVLSLRWKRQSVSKFCLGNMAVANFSVSVFCVLQNVTMFFVNTWIFGELLCKMYHFITNLCHAASILMIVVISIERYVVILHPLRCRQFLTTRTLVAIMLAVWILSAVVSLPNFFYFGLIPSERRGNGDVGHVCVPVSSIYSSAVVDTSYFLIMYLIPLIIMLTLYLRIGFFLIRREQLGRDLAEEKVAAEDAFPGSGFPRRSQKQPDGLRVKKKRALRNMRSHAAPADLSSLSTESDATTSLEGLRGQTLPQQQGNLKIGCLNMQEFRIRRNHPQDAVQIESIKEPGLQSNRLLQHCSSEQDTEGLENACSPDLIPEETLVQVRNRSQEVRKYVSCSVHGDSRSSSSTKTASTLQRSATLPSNPEALRILFRHNRLQLVHMRCKQRQRVVRRLMFMVLTFAMLNLPHHLRKLCLLYLPSCEMAKEVNNLIAPLTFALMYANCAVNPILYAFTNKNYRATLREFCFGRRRNIGVV